MQKFEEYAYEACYKLQDKTVVFNGVSRNIKKKLFLLIACNCQYYIKKAKMLEQYYLNANTVKLYRFVYYPHMKKIRKSRAARSEVKSAGRPTVSHQITIYNLFDGHQHFELLWKSDF